MPALLPSLLLAAAVGAPVRSHNVSARLDQTISRASAYLVRALGPQAGDGARSWPAAARESTACGRHELGQVCYLMRSRALPPGSRGCLCSDKGYNLLRHGMSLPHVTRVITLRKTRHCAI
jgi:hypothetical protein